MPKRKTHDEFIKQFQTKMGNDYTVIGTYITGITPIDVLHHVCNKIYQPTPKDILAGKSRCGHCFGGGRVAAKYRNFKKEFLDKLPKDYILISEFNTKKVILKHSICNHEFSVMPTHFKSGRRCPKCAGTKRKTHSEFVNDVKRLSNNEMQIISGVYKNNTSKFKFLHKVCNRTSEFTAKKFMRGQRCKFCSLERNESSVVGKIRSFLSTNNITYYNEVEFEGYLYRYDLFLPDYNLLIEYDGEQHFYGWWGESINKVRERDQKKNELALLSDYNLVRLNLKHKKHFKNILKECFDLSNQGSETIESQKVYFQCDGKIFNKREYYLSAREDYFSCE